MRDNFLRILAAVAADPEHPLAELPLAKPASQEQDLAILLKEAQ